MSLALLSPITLTSYLNFRAKNVWCIPARAYFFFVKTQRVNLRKLKLTNVQNKVDKIGSYLDFLGVAGVPGGVTPLPLALLSPITLTSSLTDTPINSGGISLLTEAAAAEAAEATFDLVGLCEPGLFMASPLNHFYRGQKKKGFEYIF